MQIKSIVIALALFTASLSAMAQSATATLLAPATEIDKRCKFDRPFGIFCQRNWEDAPVIDPDAPGIPLDGQEHLPFDLPSMRVVAILHLTPASTSDGFAYYTATVERLKSNFLNNGFSPTDRFEATVWRYLTDSHISNTNTGSPAEQQYLAEQDNLIRMHRANQVALEAARQKAQAIADYEESPQGQKDAADKAVASCRKIIVNAQHAIAQDKRVEAVSGVQNMVLREQAGVAIVNCEDTIARNGYPASN